MLEFIWSDVLKIVLFSLASIVVLFIIAKILGKKQIAELNFIDYIMGISIGSIAAEMATDINETSVWYYIIAMFIYLAVDLFINIFEKASPRMKKFFMGRPEVLIYENKIQFHILKKNGISVNDLLSMCRRKGFFDIKSINYAILETSGDLSILPIGKEKPTTVTDLENLQIKESSLPCYLVIDGYISFSSLSEINKDVNWLLQSLNVKTVKELKKYILVEYDDNKKEFTKYEK